MVSMNTLAFVFEMGKGVKKRRTRGGECGHGTAHLPENTITLKSTLPGKSIKLMIHT